MKRDLFGPESPDNEFKNIALKFSVLSGQAPISLQIYHMRDET